MYEIMNASPVTIVIVVAALMVTPAHAICTYTFSGASPVKGMMIGAAFLVWGAVMTAVCLTDPIRDSGPLGDLIIPICWFTPSLILVIFRRWFLDQPLSQHWLVALQLWRFIGGVFLIEMARGNIAGVFAYPAGIGDILAGTLALAILLKFRTSKTIPSAALLALIAFGMLDFLSALFFGITSAEGPFQLFSPAVENQVLLFPTGMIPLFLVPYAIFYHTLSFLSLRQHADDTMETPPN